MENLALLVCNRQKLTPNDTELCDERKHYYKVMCT